MGCGKSKSKDGADPVMELKDLKRLPDKIKSKRSELGPYVFETPIVQDNRKRKIGRRKSKNGNIDICERTKDGQPNGKGIRIQITGEQQLFEGYWQDGKWTNGRVIYDDGTYYIGDFKYEKDYPYYDGYGEWYLPNGNKYVGRLKENLPHGRGCFTYGAFNIIEDGWFVNERFCGKNKPTGCGF